MNLAVCLGLLTGTWAQNTPPAPPEIPLEDHTAAHSLQRLYPRHAFDCPVALATMPLDEPRLVVVKQRGEVWLLPQDPVLGTPEKFLDLTEKLKHSTEFEEGFHGLAFHPQFAVNGRFYLSYSLNHPRRNVLSEMRVLPGRSFKADPGSERILLEVPHIMANHFGGGIAFGPDNMLYLAIGDGGMRDDPYRLAQNPFALHGKMLRLDVDTRTGDLPYGIPADNPFATVQEYRPEIWALGLRNPWGFAFDTVTGDLWLADVGQDLWEEVNLIKKGLNYGWSDRDGPHAAAFHSHPFLPDREYEDPVFAYGRAEGISITGGFLYRGQRLPRLQGSYIYGDWGHGHLSSIFYDPESRRVTSRKTLHRRAPEAVQPFNPTMIASDPQGEIIILSQDGFIYTLVSAE